MLINALWFFISLLGLMFFGGEAFFISLVIWFLVNALIPSISDFFSTIKSITTPVYEEVKKWPGGKEPNAIIDVAFVVILFVFVVIFHFV